MASPIFFGQGLAGTGIDTATLLPDLFAVNTIWVNSAGGSDANAGTEPELPVATLAQAITNASAGSCIAIAATHIQTISVALAANKAGLRFVGFGTGSARPTLTPASGATSVFNVTANDVVFENIYFKAAAATSGTGGRIVSANSGTEVLACQFDCGASDQEAVLLNTGADNARIDSCTFTATASRPTRAIGLAGATNTNVKITNTTVDGSTFGWAGNAVTVNNCVRLVVKALTLAGNADLSGTTTTSYQIYGLLGSGASRVSLS